jgi:hypothetical protein
MKKALLAVAVLAAFVGHAQAGQSFNAGAGFSSSVTLSGGSMASSASNADGYSSQHSDSNAAGFAAAYQGGAAGVSFANPVAAAGATESYAVGSSNTNSTSYGRTGGNGVGETKGGSGVDYSAGSYGYANVSYSY